MYSTTTSDGILFSFIGCLRHKQRNRLGVENVVDVRFMGVMDIFYFWKNKSFGFTATLFGAPPPTVARKRVQFEHEAKPHQQE